MFLPGILDLSKISNMHEYVTPEYSNDLRNEFAGALDDILQYWKKNTIDEMYGGFAGRIDEFEQRIPNAEKGVVLNARVLWTFSAAYLFNKDKQWLDLADRCFLYFRDYFIDKDFGGVFWTVRYDGTPSNTRKQSYALSFAIYGLTEYYRASGNNEALLLVKDLYADLEKHAYDRTKGGYWEAFTRDWRGIEDLRLSDKDANEKKTMNTHLHVLEAYTNLYRVWPDLVLKQQIVGLINNFTEHIINEEGHLGLFFDDDWKLKSSAISYGHDIEASWLIQEAAEIIEDKLLIEQTKLLALNIAKATAAGIDSDGGLNYEYDPATGHLISEKHWWVQAEAMVGLVNAWQISGDSLFFEQFKAVWQFTKTQLLDKVNGEWFWGLNGDHSFMQGEDKVGLWKCPYHNSRACMELFKRLV